MDLQADFGVIVALHIECAAVLRILDDYSRLPASERDPNVYYIGTINIKPSIGDQHIYRIVVAQCPKMGNNGAAMVAKDLIRTFRVKHVLMVGIAAGIPNPKNPERHVRLGDVVVSSGKGIIQYDLNKRHSDGSIEIRSALPPPSRVLLGAVDSLEVLRINGFRPWEDHIVRLGELGHRPAPESDKLYISYGKERTRWKRAPHPKDDRPFNQPKIHLGVIGSGNCLMKDVRERDRLASELGVLALEMEGAGVADASWNQTEVSDYLVIRGISDYADRNKNDAWRAYASAIAAAYLRALLEMEPIPLQAMERAGQREDTLMSLDRRVLFDEAILRYLKWLRNTAKEIVIRGGDRVFTLPLSDIFVSLDVSSRKREFDKNDIEPMLDAIDFSSLWPTELTDSDSAYSRDSATIRAESLLGVGSKIVLVGGTGSGKTTLLQYICYVLSKHLLGEGLENDERLGLICDFPIPVLIPLNAYANHLRKLSEDTDPNERTLLRFVEHYITMRQAYLDLPLNFFSRLLQAGRHVVLLLDGLDEVADEKQRVQISRAIQDSGFTPFHLSFIVTSRTTAYQGETVLPSNFQEWYVRPLDSRLVGIMIERLCVTAFPDDEIERNNSIDRLNHSIQELEKARRQLSPVNNRLIESPLLVRILFTLFLKFGQVATRRTELFRDYINTVLQASYNPDISVAQRLSESAGPLPNQLSILGLLAIELHKKSEHGESYLKEAEVKSVIVKYLHSISSLQDLSTLQQQFLEMMRHRGGLVVFKENEFRFAHLAFQEFLVATHLQEIYKSSTSLLRFFLENNRICRAWWHEPLIHCMGLLFAEDKEKGEEILQILCQLVETPLEETPTKLAALEAMAEICMERPLNSNTKQKVSQLIQSCLFGNSIKYELNIRLRADLGRVLGILGDNRKDVACSIPTMNTMPAGIFIMGHPVDHSIVDLPSMQSGTYEIHIDEYAIGRYPVTNYQFGSFVLAGGYSEKGRHFWSEAGWEWKISRNILTPAFWTMPQWSIENHPIVGVSWFEAFAYCRWLFQETGRHFRLPTESEWEKAAKGYGIWPWGSGFQAEYANTIESGIGGVTCVGLFTEGGSPNGIMDTAGNVWEWCNSEFRTYGRYELDDGRECTEGLAPRCIRGGSWLNNKDRARTANRDHYFPGDRHSDLGFRVVEII